MYVERQKKWRRWEEEELDPMSNIYSKWNNCIDYVIICV